MILGVEPVERRADVVDFAFAVIVFPLAQTRAAKIEAQDRKSETVQRLHGVKDDLVMQRSTKKRMRMTDHGCMTGIHLASVKKGFQTPCWTIEKKRTDG